MSFNVIISRARDSVLGSLISTSCSKSKSRCRILSESSYWGILAWARRLIFLFLISTFSTEAFASLNIYTFSRIIGSWAWNLLTQMVHVLSTQWPSSFCNWGLMLISSRTRCFLTWAKVKLSFKAKRVCWRFLFSYSVFVVVCSWTWRSLLFVWASSNCFSHSKLDKLTTNEDHLILTKQLKGDKRQDLD